MITVMTIMSVIDKQPLPKLMKSTLSVFMSSNSVLNEHSPKSLHPVVNALPR